MALLRGQVQIEAPRLRPEGGVEDRRAFGALDGVERSGVRLESDGAEPRLHVPPPVEDAAPGADVDQDQRIQSKQVLQPFEDDSRLPH
jgi:hypothetical protein